MSFSPPSVTIGMIFFIILATCHVFDCQLMMSNSSSSNILSSFSENIIFSTKYFSRLQILMILITIFPIVITLRRVINFLIERRRVFNLIERIPGPPCHPIPFLGHAGIVLDLDRTRYEHGTYALIYQMLTGVHCMYGQETLLRMWMGCRPFVLIFNASGAETILSSNTLTDKSSEYSWLKPWLGEGLVTSNKNKWKLRRKILTPAFHFKILQDFLPIINEQSMVLINKLYRLIDEAKEEGNTENDKNIEEEENISSKNISSSKYIETNILPLITLCTLDTICETAMGIKVYAQEKESKYVKCLHQVSELVVFRLTRPWLWPDIIFYNSKYGKRFKYCLNIMQDFTSNVIKERKSEWITHNGHLLENENSESQNAESQNFEKQNTESRNAEPSNNNKRRLAFLDLLLHQHLVNETLTLDDVREEVDTFMFAGHDTTAMAISWTMYMLGLHQDVQEKVRIEIDEIFDESNETNERNDEINSNISSKSENIFVTIEMMKRMKYLDCVLKEVQRIYPTAPFVGRELTEDVTINGYDVPKGTTAGILTFLLHRDPTVFPNPEKFDPDRFLPENSIGRHPYSFVPFSAGPRNCIGQKFAQMEQKIVISSFLRNFTIKSLDPRDKLVVVGEMVLRPRNGLRVLITPRNNVSARVGCTLFNSNQNDLRNI